MIHHICLLETKPQVTVETLEEMMIETRIRLLKIPEISHLKVGKRIDTVNNPYKLFFNFDVENMDKLNYALESAIYVQYQRQVLEPNVSKTYIYNYEMEPGKDVKYS